MRMALGAHYGRILRMVLRQGVVQLALGLFARPRPGARRSRRLAGTGIQNILFGVSARDPLTYSVVVGADHGGVAGRDAGAGAPRDARRSDDRAARGIAKLMWLPPSGGRPRAVNYCASVLMEVRCATTFDRRSGFCGGGGASRRIAAATLAVGIGATTFIFSAADAALVQTPSIPRSRPARRFPRSPLARHGRADAFRLACRWKQR